jgi:enamine deaminase RidA (YjgF/YER057c/UK114 family)
MTSRSRLGLVNPEELGVPRGFSHGVLAPAGSRLLFVAGQIGWDREAKLVPGGFPGQFQRALENVRTVVESAGGGVGDICRFTIFITDRRLYLAELREIGEAYRRVMGRHFPAMALVEVAALLESGALVEIEATAALAPEVPEAVAIENRPVEAGSSRRQGQPRTRRPAG